MQSSPAGGITPSERYLAYLARKSFLSLWSYSNLYTDEGRGTRGGDGKELCDLMAVFDDHVLLFSDKHCVFVSNPNIQISWSRWFKRAVLKSARQIAGAESWLRRFPNRLFLDRACTKLFPLPIPDLSKIKIHRIVVTRGSYDACYKNFGGQSTGSLMINSSLMGNDHLNMPFCIGHILPEKGYFHVFDELTLDVVLRELDTISDFVGYLIKKERLLTRSDQVIMASGEEQLVGMYLTKLNDKGEHDFTKIPPDATGVSINEGFWEDFIKNPQYIAKKKADEISYAWDRLIEVFAGNIMSGRIMGPSTDIAYYERSIHFMAAEPRVRRRQLAESLIGALKKAQESPGMKLARLAISNDFPDTAYVFLILPVTEGVDYEEYRNFRKDFLLAYCKVTILKAKTAKRIIGFSTEPPGRKSSSEDLILLEPHENEWSLVEEEEAKKLQQDLGILLDVNVQTYDNSVKEYPDLLMSTNTKDGKPPLQNPYTGMNRARRRELAKKMKRK